MRGAANGPGRRLERDGDQPNGKWPCELPRRAPLCRPDTSTINFSAGQTRANNAVITLDAGGLLAYPVLVGSGTVDLILDVSGYLE
jgi:hypothetical protein